MIIIHQMGMYPELYLDLSPDNEATLLRVPRYEFTILSEGEMHRFRDVPDSEGWITY